MGSVDTAEERDDRRDVASRGHATTRAERVAQYDADKAALEQEYYKDLKDIDKAQAVEYVDAGLNPDGSDPQGRQQGSEV